MNLFKKSLVSIIAVSILIIFVVFIVFFYQTWFNSYQSRLNLDVEKESNSRSMGYGIERVVGTDLYYKNSMDEILEIRKLEIGGIDCNVSGNFTGSIINIDVSVCIHNLTLDVNDIVIYTDKNIYTKTQYFNEINIFQENNGYTNQSILVVNTLLIKSGPLSLAGSSGFDKSDNVFVDNLGNIYIIGNTDSDYLNLGNGFSITNQGSYDFFLVKYNSSGSVQFVKTAEDNSGTSYEFFTGLYVDNLSNIYVVGYGGGNISFGNSFSITNDGSYDFFLVKYNSSGVPQFVKTDEFSSGNLSDKVEDVFVDDFGNIFIAGYSKSNLNFGNGVNITNQGDEDFFLVKYNSSGIAQFVKTSEFGSGNYSDNIKSVFVDNLGNIYVGGDTKSSLNFGNGVNFTNQGYDDFFLVKYNSSGIAQFVKTSESGSGTSSDFVRDIFVDDLGNIYFLGFTSSDLDFGNGNTINLPGAYDFFFVVKYNSSGVAQFARTVNGVNSVGGDDEDMFNIFVFNNSDVYIIGYTHRYLNLGDGVTFTPDGYHDILLIKYNSSGNTQFVKSSLGGTAFKEDQGKDVFVDEYGNFYIVGLSHSSLSFGNNVNLTNQGGGDFFLVKYNSSFQAQFVKTSQLNFITGYDYVKDITIDSLGNIYVVGYTNSNFLDFGNGVNITNQNYYDFFLVKYNSSGVAQFVKTSENFSGDDDDYGLFVSLDSLGNIFLGGQTRSDFLDFGNGVNISSNSIHNNFFIVKYNELGVPQSVISSPNGNNNYFNDFQDLFIDSNDDIYARYYVFNSFDFGNGINVSSFGKYLVKYDNFGNPQFVKNFYGNSFFVDSDSNIYESGSFFGNIDFGNGFNLTSQGSGDFFLVKYNSSLDIQFLKTSESGSGIGYDSANDVFVDSLGNIYVLGQTMSDLNFGNGFSIINQGSYDFFLVKYNSSASVQFVKSNLPGSGESYDYGKQVFVNNLGYISVIGTTSSVNLDFGNDFEIFGTSLFTVIYDNLGSTIFATNTLNGTAEFGGLQFDDLGDLYLGGTTSNNIKFSNISFLTNVVSSDFFVIKYENITG